MVSNRRSGSRIEVDQFAPGPELARVVERMWVGRWDIAGDTAHTTELLGDPAVHLVFEAGQASIVGVWTRLWTRTLEGRGFVRAVKFHPGASRAVFDIDARMLTNRRTALGAVVDDAESLVPQVLGPAQDVEGLANLAAWLRARTVFSDEVGLAIRLVRRVMRTRILRVDELAEDAGLSVRSVQRLFARHVGATPKWVIRRSRLQEVAERVEAREAPVLADLAYELGYADQAHLARDFKSVTGRTLRGFEEDVHRQ